MFKTASTELNELLSKLGKAEETRDQAQQDFEMLLAFWKGEEDLGKRIISAKQHLVNLETEAARLDAKVSEYHAYFKKPFFKRLFSSSPKAA